MQSNRHEQIAVAFFNFALRRVGSQAPPDYLYKDIQALGQILNLYGFPRLLSFAEIQQEFFARGAENVDFTDPVNLFDNIIEFCVLYVDYQEQRGIDALNAFLRFVDTVYVSKLEDYTYSQYQAMLHVVFSDLAANNAEIEQYQYLLERLHIFTTYSVIEMQNGQQEDFYFSECFLFNYFAKSGPFDSSKAMAICKLMFQSENQQLQADSLKWAAQMQQQLTTMTKEAEKLGKCNTVGEVDSLLINYQKQYQFNAFRDQLVQFLQVNAKALIAGLQMQQSGQSNELKIVDTNEAIQLMCQKQQQVNKCVFDGVGRAAIIQATETLSKQLYLMCTQCQESGNGKTKFFLDSGQQISFEQIEQQLLQIGNNFKENSLINLAIGSLSLISQTFPLVNMDVKPLDLDENEYYQQSLDLITAYCQDEANLSEAGFIKEFITFYLTYLQHLLDSEISSENKKLISQNFLSQNEINDIIQQQEELQAQYNKCKSNAQLYGSAEKVSLSLRSQYELLASGIFRELTQQLRCLLQLFNDATDSFTSQQVEEELYKVLAQNVEIDLSEAKMTKLFSDLNLCVFGYTRYCKISGFRGIQLEESEMNDKLAQLSSISDKMQQLNLPEISGELSIGNLKALFYVCQCINKELLQKQVLCDKIIRESQQQVRAFQAKFIKAIQLLQQARNAVVQARGVLSNACDINVVNTENENVQSQIDNIGEKSSFIKIYQELNYIVYSQFLLECSVSPIIYISCISYLQQLRGEWNTQFNDLISLQSDYRIVIQAYGLIDKFFNQQLQVDQIEQFINVFEAYQAMQAQPSLESGKDSQYLLQTAKTNKNVLKQITSNEICCQKIDKSQAYALINECYSSVKNKKDILLLLTQVSLVIQQKIAEVCKQEYPLLADQYYNYQNIYLKYLKYSQQADILYVDNFIKKLSGKDYQIRTTDIQDEILLLQKDADNIKAVLLDYRDKTESHVYQDFAVLFDQQCKIKELQQTINFIIESFPEQHKNDKLSQLSIDQFYQDVISWMHKVFNVSFDTSTIDRYFLNYNFQCGTWESQLLQLRQLSDEIERQRKICEDFVIAGVEQFKELISKQLTRKQYKETVQEMRSMALLIPSQKNCGYQPLNYVYQCLQYFVQQKKNFDRIVKAQKEDFATSTQGIFDQFVQNNNMLIDSMLIVTARGCQLKQLYIENPAPDDLLELKQILQYLQFLQEVLQIIKNLQSKTFLQAELRKIDLKIVFSQVVLPELPDKSQEIMQIEAYINQLRQLNIATLNIDNKMVLQHFIFEDCTFEYSLQKQLSSCTAEDIEECQQLYNNGTMFGFQGCAIRDLRAVNTFNDYCGGLSQALSTSPYAQNILRQLDYLDQPDELLEIVSHDINIAQFCMQFDHTCQKSLNELLLGHCTTSSIDEQEFQKRVAFAQQFGSCGYPYELMNTLQIINKNVVTQLQKEQIKQLKTLQISQNQLDMCQNLLFACHQLLQQVNIQLPKWSDVEILNCENAIQQICLNIIQIIVVLRTVNDDNVKQQLLQICGSLVSLSKQLDAQKNDILIKRGMQLQHDSKEFAVGFVNIVNSCIIAFEGIISDLPIASVDQKYQNVYEQIVRLAQEIIEQCQTNIQGNVLQQGDQAVKNLLKQVNQTINSEFQQYFADSQAIIKALISQILDQDEFIQFKDNISAFANRQILLSRNVNQQLAKLQAICGSSLLLDNIHLMLFRDVFDSYTKVICVSKCVKQLIIGYQQAFQGFSEVVMVKQQISNLSEHHSRRFANCYDKQVAIQALERCQQQLTLVIQQRIPRLQKEINISCLQVQEMIQQIAQVYADYFDQTDLLTIQPGQQLLQQYIIDIDELCVLVQDFSQLPFQCSSELSQLQFYRQNISAQPLQEAFMISLYLANCYNQFKDGQFQKAQLNLIKFYPFDSTIYCEQLHSLYNSIVKSSEQMSQNIETEFLSTTGNFVNSLEEFQGKKGIFQYDISEYIKNFSKCKLLNNIDKLNAFQEEFQGFLAKSQKVTFDTFKKELVYSLKEFLDSVVEMAVQIDDLRISYIKQAFQKNFQSNLEPVLKQISERCHYYVKNYNQKSSDVFAIRAHFYNQMARQLYKDVSSILPGFDQIQDVFNIDTKETKLPDKSVQIQSHLVLRAVSASSTDLLIISDMLDALTREAPTKINFSASIAQKCLQFIYDLFQNNTFNCQSHLQLAQTILRQLDIFGVAQTNNVAAVAEGQQLKQVILEQYASIQKQQNNYIAELLATAFPIYISSAFDQRFASSDFLIAQLNDLVDLLNGDQETNIFSELQQRYQDMNTLLKEYKSNDIPPEIKDLQNYAQIKLLTSVLIDISEREDIDVVGVSQQLNSLLQASASEAEKDQILEKLIVFNVQTSFIANIPDQYSNMKLPAAEFYDYTIKPALGVTGSYYQAKQREYNELTKPKEHTILEQSFEIQDLLDFIQQQQNALEIELAALSSQNPLYVLTNKCRTIHSAVLRYNTLGFLFNQLYQQIPILENFGLFQLNYIFRALPSISADFGLFKLVSGDVKSQIVNEIGPLVVKMPQYYEILQDYGSYQTNVQVALQVYFQQVKQIADFNALYDVAQLCCSTMLMYNGVGLQSEESSESTKEFSSSRAYYSQKEGELQYQMQVCSLAARIIQYALQGQTQLIAFTYPSFNVENYLKKQFAPAALRKCNQIRSQVINQFATSAGQSELQIADPNLQKQWDFGELVAFYQSLTAEMSGEREALALQSQDEYAAIGQALERSKTSIVNCLKSASAIEIVQLIGQILEQPDAFCFYQLMVRQFACKQALEVAKQAPKLTFLAKEAAQQLARVEAILSRQSIKQEIFEQFYLQKWESWVKKNAPGLSQGIFTGSFEEVEGFMTQDELLGCR